MHAWQQTVVSETAGVFETLNNQGPGLTERIGVGFRKIRHLGVKVSVGDMLDMEEREIGLLTVQTRVYMS